MSSYSKLNEKFNALYAYLEEMESYIKDLESIKSNLDVAKERNNEIPSVLEVYQEEARTLRNMIMIAYKDLWSIDKRK